MPRRAYVPAARKRSASAASGTIAPTFRTRVRTYFFSRRTKSRAKSSDGSQDSAERGDVGPLSDDEGEIARLHQQVVPVPFLGDAAAAGAHEIPEESGEGGKHVRRPERRGRRPYSPSSPIEG